MANFDRIRMTYVSSMVRDLSIETFRTVTDGCVAFLCTGPRECQSTSTTMFYPGSGHADYT
eukprot:scaffold67619_cov58-Attheya_sp.AAC.1